MYTVKKFFDKNQRIEVGNYDTFVIPFVIKYHAPIDGESYIFTVRRVTDCPARAGKYPNLGDIVFQKTIHYSDVAPITDETGTAIGCYFCINATKAETANIPAGLNAYDLAYACGDSEFELIPPSEFWSGEVLRYEQ
jgi:hypothetical protein